MTGAARSGLHPCFTAEFLECIKGPPVHGSNYIMKKFLMSNPPKIMPGSIRSRHNSCPFRHKNSPLDVLRHHTSPLAFYAFRASGTSLVQLAILSVFAFFRTLTDVGPVAWKKYKRFVISGGRISFGFFLIFWKGTAKTTRPVVMNSISCGIRTNTVVYKRCELWLLKLL